MRKYETRNLETLVKGLNGATLSITLTKDELQQLAGRYDLNKELENSGKLNQDNIAMLVRLVGFEKFLDKFESANSDIISVNIGSYEKSSPSQQAFPKFLLDASNLKSVEIFNIDPGFQSTLAARISLNQRVKNFKGTFTKEWKNKQANNTWTINFPGEIIENESTAGGNNTYAPFIIEKYKAVQKRISDIIGTHISAGRQVIIADYRTGQQHCDTLFRPALSTHFDHIGRNFSYVRGYFAHLPLFVFTKEMAKLDLEKGVRQSTDHAPHITAREGEQRLNIESATLSDILPRSYPAGSLKPESPAPDLQAAIPASSSHQTKPMVTPSSASTSPDNGGAGGSTIVPPIGSDHIEAVSEGELGTDFDLLFNLGENDSDTKEIDHLKDTISRLVEYINDRLSHVSTRQPRPLLGIIPIDYARLPENKAIAALEALHVLMKQLCLSNQKICSSGSNTLTIDAIDVIVSDQIKKLLVVPTGRATNIVNDWLNAPTQNPLGTKERPSVRFPVEGGQTQLTLALVASLSKGFNLHYTLLKLAPESAIEALKKHGFAQTARMDQENPTNRSTR
jgi:hypothetical protein